MTPHCHLFLQVQLLWHSHWQACQLWALPFLQLGSCPAFQDWVHWQCITALCWRSTQLGQAFLGLQLFARNAGVMAKPITSEPSRANLTYNLFLFLLQHNLGSLLCRLETRVFRKMRAINRVILGEQKHLWSHRLAPCLVHYNRHWCHFQRLLL